MPSQIIIWGYRVKHKEQDFFRQLGKRIAELRKAQGLTQTQLGEMLDLSQQIIASYEAGRRHVSVWRLFAVAEALGITPQEILQANGQVPRKRGPAPKVQQLVERINHLPPTRQKFVTAMIENALQVQ